MGSLQVPELANRSLAGRLTDSLPGQLLQQGLYGSLFVAGGYLIYKGVDITALTAIADQAQGGSADDFFLNRWFDEPTMNQFGLRNVRGNIRYGDMNQEQLVTGYIRGPFVAMAGALLSTVAFFSNKVRKARRTQIDLAKRVMKYEVD